MAYGGEILLRPRSWRRVGRFALVATAAALSPSSYTRVARAVAVRQVYLTAWKILPGYLLAAALFAMVLIEIVHGAAKAYGLGTYSIELVLRVLVLEFIPLITALFVALRTGSAVGADIALMRVEGRMEEGGGGALIEELAPRAAAAALSVFALTTLACALAMYLAYAMNFGTSNAGFRVFTRIVAHVFDGVQIAAFALKSLLFGLAVGLIPLATGLEAQPGQPRTLPAAVLAGLVKLFIVIAVIEVLMLLVVYG